MSMNDPLAPRPHPLMWQDIEGPDVLSPGTDVELDPFAAPAAPLRAFELPPAIAPFARVQLGESDPVARAEAKALLEQVRDALAAAGEGRGGRLLRLDGLSETGLALVEDALGEGEATIMIAGPLEYQIQETVFPGLWDVRTLTTAGVPVDRHLEVGPVPLVVLAAAQDLTAERFVMPQPDAETRAGLMNIMPLLAEIDARMRDGRPGGANHVISLTNLPMSEGDLQLLGQTIGGGAILAHSRGYGATRVTATRARDVWQVEYLNSMGQVILDTMEIGGPPAALVAAPEDFEDSAARIVALLEVS